MTYDHFILNVIMFVAFIPTTALATALAFLYTKRFSGTPFEKPWKALFLIPIYILVAVIVEITNVGFPYLRFLGAAVALLTLLYILYRFYKTLTIIQPYTGSIIVKFEASGKTVNRTKNLTSEGDEQVFIRRDMYEKLSELANERSMTINQFVYGVVVPEWFSIKYRSKYYKSS